MRLSTLSVKNFRSIADESFDLGALSVLIGKNNVGKSNVLLAVQRLLESTAKDFDDRDLHDASAELVLEGLLHGVRALTPLVDDRNRVKIEACIQGDDSIRIRRSSANGYKLEIWQPDKGEFGMPSGIEAPLKTIIPEVISVEAFIDPAAHADGKDSATLGKLLKVILDELKTDTDDAMKRGLETVNALLNRVTNEDGEEEDNRSTTLKTIESTLSQYLGEAFEGASARIRVDLPEMKQMLSRAKVELHDGAEWTDAEYKGQGQQRALYVALLRAWATHRRLTTQNDTKRPILLLVEEPESFLHPSAHAVVRAALEEISKQTQVVFTTHSPTMISPARIGETVLVRKRTVDGGRTSQTYRLKPLKEAVQEQEKRVRDLFLYPRSSRFLFADHVLVVEGQSDAELLDAVCFKITGASLEDRGFCCVDASDKVHVTACMAILESRGIDVFGLVDLDFMWRGAEKLVSGDASFSKFRQDLFKDARERGWIDEQGNVVKGAKPQLIAHVVNQYVAQRDATAKTLRENHRVWCLANGEIEAYVGLSPSSKSDYARAAAEIRVGERAINNADELELLLRWIGVLPAQEAATGEPVAAS